MGEEISNSEGFRLDLIMGTCRVEVEVGFTIVILPIVEEN